MKSKSIKHIRCVVLYSYAASMECLSISGATNFEGDDVDAETEPPEIIRSVSFSLISSVVRFRMISLFLVGAEVDIATMLNSAKFSVAFLDPFPASTAGMSDVLFTSVGGEGCDCDWVEDNIVKPCLTLNFCCCRRLPCFAVADILSTIEPNPFSCSSLSREMELVSFCLEAMMVEYSSSCDWAIGTDRVVLPF